VEEGVDQESANEDRSPADELRAGTPEGRTEHEANEEEGKDEIADFRSDMKLVCGNSRGRGWRSRSKCATDKVSQ
jgi:hypothetical protein